LSGFGNESIFRLEAFNSIISHTLTDNVNLIYGVLRAHKVFENLANFTLLGALREIKRIKAQKANSSSKDIQGPTNASLEKAQQLEHEGIETSSHHASRSGSISMSSTNDPMLPPLPADGVMTPPTGEDPGPDFGRGQQLSEKAKGKRPQRTDSMSLSTSLEQLAQAGVGRNGFVPTQEWVCI
jgi:hypothetical protein